MQRGTVREQIWRMLGRCTSKLQRLFSAICGLAALATIGSSTYARVNDDAAREQAGEAVRARLHLEAGKFLRVQMQEALEQLLAGVVARPSWAEFIYKVSEEGDEIKEHAVVHHIVTDGDPTFTIASILRVGACTVYRAFPTH